MQKKGFRAGFRRFCFRGAKKTSRERKAKERKGEKEKGIEGGKSEVRR